MKKQSKNTITAFVELKNGFQLEVVLPSMKVVCHRCDGTGTHVNPSIDGHGLSSDELADDDFRESYFRGDYDVKCHECDGERVLSVVDYDRLTPKMKARFDRAIDTKRRDEMEAAGERRWGC